MTSKPENTHKIDGRGRQGLRPLELFDTIAAEIERERRAVQWQAEIPAEWTASVEARVAREIAGWPDEMPGTAKAGTSSAATQIARGFATFRASFEGAYQSLLAARFPSLPLPPILPPPVGAMAVRGGTRSETVEPGAAGIVASKDPAGLRPLIPTQEEAPVRLPAWVVVPYANALLPGTEFAILWAGEDEAPDLPSLDLRLDGQPWDENVFWPEVRSNVAGLPPGDVAFVKFDELKPRGFTIIQSEDGGLVVDFTMT